MREKMFIILEVGEHEDHIKQFLEFLGEIGAVLVKDLTKEYPEQFLVLKDILRQDCEGGIQRIEDFIRRNGGGKLFVVFLGKIEAGCSSNILSFWDRDDVIYSYYDFDVGSYTPYNDILVKAFLILQGGKSEA